MYDEWDRKLQLRFQYTSMSNRHGPSRQYKDRPRYDERERDTNGRDRDYGPSSHSDYYSSTTTPPTAASSSRRLNVNDGKKLYIGGLPTYGITQEIVMSDFAQYGQIQDCFVPMDRNEGNRIRGIVFITFTEALGPGSTWCRAHMWRCMRTDYRDPAPYEGVQKGILLVSLGQNPWLFFKLRVRAKSLVSF